MKQVLLSLAMHHEWASKTLFKKLETLPDELLNRQMVSSFPGINETLFHLYLAETIWWQRLQLQEHITGPDESVKADFQVLSKEILRLAAYWIAFIGDANEKKLTHVFEYRNSKREAFKQPVYEVLLHVFNHQTYHHGQIITLLRQANIQKLPATDFIEFSRRKGR